jgi:hypothetical protein
MTKKNPWFALGVFIVGIIVTLALIRWAIYEGNILIYILAFIVLGSSIDYLIRTFYRKYFKQ